MNNISVLLASNEYIVIKESKQANVDSAPLFKFAPFGDKPSQHPPVL